MKFNQVLGIVAIIGIGAFCYTQYRKLKKNETLTRPKIKK